MSRLLRKSVKVRKSRPVKSSVTTIIFDLKGKFTFPSKVTSNYFNFLKMVMEMLE